METQFGLLFSLLYQFFSEILIHSKPSARIQLRLLSIERFCRKRLFTNNFFEIVLQKNGGLSYV
jgi:hypothetical protein